MWGGGIRNQGRRAPEREGQKRDLLSRFYGNVSRSQRDAPPPREEEKEAERVQRRVFCAAAVPPADQGRRQQPPV